MFGEGTGLSNGLRRKWFVNTRDQQVPHSPLPRLPHMYPTKSLSVQRNNKCNRRDIQYGGSRLWHYAPVAEKWGRKPLALGRAASNPPRTHLRQCGNMPDRPRQMHVTERLAAILPPSSLASAVCGPTCLTLWTYYA